MYIQNNTTRRKVSEILAIAAMTLLLIDTVDTFIARSRYGLLPLNDQQGGILLGVSSIILFFYVLWIGFKEKTKITTSLLIAGGALLVVSKLVEPTLGLNLYLAISLPYLYITLIAIGCILIGLGLLRKVVRKQ